MKREHDIAPLWPPQPADRCQPSAFVDEDRLAARIQAMARIGATPGGGVEIDVPAGLSCLRDDLQCRQSRQQSFVNPRALSDQHECIEAGQRVRQCIALQRLVEHRDVVAVEQPEAVERAHGVLVVVENRDFHARVPVVGADMAGARLTRRALRSPRDRPGSGPAGRTVPTCRASVRHRAASGRPDADRCRR